MGYGFFVADGAVCDNDDISRSFVLMRQERKTHSQNDAPCPNGRSSRISIREDDGFTVHVKEDGYDYFSLYKRLRQGEIAGKVLLHDDDEHFVHLVRVDGRAFVYKRVGAADANIETTLWQFFTGPFYSRLMRRVNKATATGCDVVPEMYLVAEKMRGRLCFDKYLLLEFVEGTPMNELDRMEPYREEIAEAFRNMHAHGLSLGNVKTGNMVLSGNRVRFIDLSTRCTQFTGRAKDVLRLKSMFDIDIPTTGIRDRLALWYVGSLFWFSRTRNRIRVALGLKKPG